MKKNMKTIAHHIHIKHCSSIVYEMHPNDGIKSVKIMWRRHNTISFACQFLFSYESFIFICDINTQIHTRIWISSKYSRTSHIFVIPQFIFRTTVFLYLVFRVISKHAIHHMKMENARYSNGVLYFFFLFDGWESLWYELLWSY